MNAEEFADQVHPDVLRDCTWAASALAAAESCADCGVQAELSVHGTGPTPWVVTLDHEAGCPRTATVDPGPCRCTERLAALEAGEPVWGAVGCAAVFCPIGVPR